MSDPIIREQLIDELHRRSITVTHDGALRDELGWYEYSKNAVNKAMGRLVSDGKARRTRRQLEHLHDDDRPVEYSRVTSL